MYTKDVTKESQRRNWKFKVKDMRAEFAEAA